MRSPVFHALALILVLGLVALAPAAADQGKAAAEGDPSAKAKEDGLPSIKEVVEGMEKIDGLLPLYRKKDNLLVVIPKDKLEKPMLMATSIAGGSQLTGFQWSDMMLEFVRHGKILMVMRPETAYRTGKTEPISSAVKRTHPGYLVASLPILGEHSREGIVVSLSDLYTKSAPAFIGNLAKGRDIGLSRLATVKNFPQNIEIAVDLVGKPQGMKHGDILTVHYSLSSLPDNDYVPRLADDRVGYFLTVSKDYAKDYRDESTFVRYINRWWLQKADPDLELSPPKEPIVFYIEKTVPTRYRRYIREGIEEWNRAFEKVGFTNAIEVRQQTETQFADLDPEDVRYNFFRWIISDWTFAMGPSRVDPRTGQILDADILFDDSMVRSYMEDWDLMVEEAMLESFSPEDRRFLRDNPEWDPVRLLRREERTSPRPEHPLLAAIAEGQGPWSQASNEPPGSGRTLCNIGSGISRQLAMASLYLGAVTLEAEEEGEEGEEGSKAREWPEQFIGQLLKDTTMHEVGHTLGLRHNFKASVFRPYGDLNPGNGTDAPGDLTGSVMDYNPLNLSSDRESQGNYSMTKLGPYDFWAVEYGYTDTGKNSPEAERDPLRKIASRGAEAGHDYATDEDLWLGDPLTNTWDYGADPLDYARDRIRLARSLRETAVERMVEEGESYESARRAVNILFSSIGYSCNIASGFVGGTYFHRDHRGDPGARDPIVVVPAEKQRAALHLLRDNLFAADAFELPPELLRKLAPSRWLHWGTYGAQGAEAAYPFHDQVLSMQAWSMYQVLSPSTMQRIMDAEMAAGADADPLTLPELFTELSGAIFSELDRNPGGRSWSNVDPLISGVRRNLQRYYVSRLIDLTLQAQKGYYPRAARTLAWYELKKLNERLDGFNGAAGSLDDYSRAHLEETRERIDEALSANFSLGS